MNTRLGAASLLVLSLSGALFARAGAQSTPTPLPAPTPIVVPTLPPTNGTTQEIIRAASGVINDILTRTRINAANNTYGTVTYYKRFDMQVQTGVNSYRNIHLHQGTAINPRGATPGIGSRVEVNGQGQPDGTLEAATITISQ